MFLGFHSLPAVLNITLVAGDLEAGHLEAGNVEVVEHDQVLMYEIKRLDSHVIDSDLILNLTVSTFGGSATGQLIADTLGF